VNHRYLFEEWLRQHHPDRPILTVSAADDRYLSPDTSLAWSAWDAAWNTRPREQPHGEAFAAGKILERTSGPVTRAMHELVAKWEKAGREHGVRQFTGNDHLLFANELKATLESALGESNG
jgi:hypothetical protein